MLWLYCGCYEQLIFEVGVKCLVLLCYQKVDDCCVICDIFGGLCLLFEYYLLYFDMFGLIVVIEGKDYVLMCEGQVVFIMFEFIWMCLSILMLVGWFEYFYIWGYWISVDFNWWVVGIIVVLDGINDD